MTTNARVSLGVDAYRQVFHASPDYISISRLSDGKYLDVNPGYERFTGYTRDEVIGKTSTALGIWPDVPVRDEFVAALHQSGELHGFPTRLRTKAGEVRQVEVSATIALIDGEQALVAIVRDVTERRRIDDELTQYRAHLEEMVEQRTTELKHMAQHDVLTGLPNRALLNDRIGQAIYHAQRNAGGLALMVIDLDRFKPVNDSLGHHVGDELLKMAAQRMQDLVRKTDTVARIGGDEFVVILIDVHLHDVVAVVAQKILNALGRVFVIEGHSVEIGGSIGIALYPGDGVNAHALLTCADAAMYQAKRAGRGNYCFFTARELP